MATIISIILKHFIVILIIIINYADFKVYFVNLTFLILKVAVIDTIFIEDLIFILLVLTNFINIIIIN